MKIILFIGHHKVGSTALQTYLAENALSLLGQGILYPAVEAQGLSTLLAMAMEGQGRGQRGGHSDIPPPVNLREAHNALAFGMWASHEAARFTVPAPHDGLPPSEDMLIAIRRQIEVFAPHTMILAAEVFANFATRSPSQIGRLARFLDAVGDEPEIHIAATLRQVDDYLISWQAQRLALGHAPRSLPGGALKRYFGNIHFDYRRMLEGWLTGLPGARLRLRPYDKVLAAGGAVQDFMDGFDLVPRGARVAADARVNTGLHRGLIEIARQANCTLDPGPAQAAFRTLLRLGPELDLPRTDEVELYGAPLRAEMARRFAPIHDWLGTLTDPPGPFFAKAGDIGRVRAHHEHAVNLAALAQIRKDRLQTFPAEVRGFLSDLTLTPNFT
jgi:hypothetical protein